MVTSNFFRRVRELTETANRTKNGLTVRDLREFEFLCEKLFRSGLKASSSLWVRRLVNLNPDLQREIWIRKFAFESLLSLFRKASQQFELRDPKSMKMKFCPLEVAAELTESEEKEQNELKECCFRIVKSFLSRFSRDKNGFCSLFCSIRNLFSSGPFRFPIDWIQMNFQILETLLELSDKKPLQFAEIDRVTDWILYSLRDAILVLQTNSDSQTDFQSFSRIPRCSEYWKYISLRRCIAEESLCEALRTTTNCFSLLLIHSDQTIDSERELAFFRLNEFQSSLVSFFGKSLLFSNESWNPRKPDIYFYMNMIFEQKFPAKVPTVQNLLLLLFFQISTLIQFPQNVGAFSQKFSMDLLKFTEINKQQENPKSHTTDNRLPRYEKMERVFKRVAELAGEDLSKFLDSSIRSELRIVRDRRTEPIDFLCNFLFYNPNSKYQ